MTDSLEQSGPLKTVPSVTTTTTGGPSMFRDDRFPESPEEIARTEAQRRALVHRECDATIAELRGQIEQLTYRVEATVYQHGAYESALRATLKAAEEGERILRDRLTAELGDFYWHNESAGDLLKEILDETAATPAPTPSDEEGETITLKVDRALWSTVPGAHASPPRALPFSPDPPPRKRTFKDATFGTYNSEQWPSGNPTDADLRVLTARHAVVEAARRLAAVRAVLRLAPALDYDEAQEREEKAAVIVEAAVDALADAEKESGT